MKAVPKIEDHACVHSGMVTAEKMRKELDEMRSREARDAAKRIDKNCSRTSLAEVQRKMRGRFPAWSQLEGKADRLLLEEIGKPTKRHRAQRLS